MSSINTSTYSLTASSDRAACQQLEELAESSHEYAAGVHRIIRVERAFLDSLLEDGRERLQDLRTQSAFLRHLPGPRAPTV